MSSTRSFLDLQFLLLCVGLPEPLWGIIGAVVGSAASIIATLLIIRNEKRRWLLSRPLENRTSALIDAWGTFLKAYYSINDAANIGGSEKDLFENAYAQIDQYLMAISVIDIWIANKKSREKLSNALGVFRFFSHQISQRQRDASFNINHKDWNRFIKTKDEIRSVIAQEIGATQLAQMTRDGDYAQH